MSSSTMKHRSKSADEGAEKKPEVFGPSESEGRQFDPDAEGGEKKGGHHKQVHGEVDADASDAGMVVEDKAMVDGYREKLRDWLRHSELEIHAGLEDALATDICKQCDALEEVTREKVVDSVKEHVKDKAKELGIDALKSQHVKGAAAGRVMKNHLQNEVTAVAKGATAVGSAVFEAKEIVDAYAQQMIGDEKAETLIALVAQMRGRSELTFGEYHQRVNELSDDEVIAAEPSTKHLLYNRHAVAFWFRQIVEAQMLASGVYHGAERNKAVQELLHPDSIVDPESRENGRGSDEG